MAQIDLQKLALRLKIVELLKTQARRRGLREARTLWRNLIQAT